MSKQLTIATMSVPATEQDQIRQSLSGLRDLGVGFELVADAARADILIIDADSMYGHMDWLKAQASGRNVICLTAATGHEQDNVLHRPIGVGGIKQCLLRAAKQAGVSIAAAMVAARNESQQAPARNEPVTPIAPLPQQTAALRPRTDPNQRAVPADAQKPVAPAAPVPPPVAAPAAQAAPAPVAAPPVAIPAAAAGRTTNPNQSAISAPTLLRPRAVTNPNQRAVTAADAPPAAAPTPAAAAPAAVASVAAEVRPSALSLADYFLPENLPRAAKIERAGLPPLVIDAEQDRYYAGLTLKPLLGYCQGSIAANEWKPLSDAEIGKFRASNSGLALSRLLWLYVLGTSNGMNLLPGFDNNGKFKLSKWPQIEREFPKHFRIGTAMMKGPAGLQEIADAAGAALGEVVDFVNAYAAIGFAAQDGVNINVERKAILERLRQRAH